MGTINVNGKIFRGNSINMVGNRIFVDGVEQTGGIGEVTGGIVEIRVTEGTLNHLTCDASVTCGDVGGNVSAGGSVRCGDIGGHASAGGSVRAENIAGHVSAGGSIKCERHG